MKLVGGKLIEHFLFKRNIDYRINTICLSFFSDIIGTSAEHKCASDRMCTDSFWIMGFNQFY